MAYTKTWDETAPDGAADEVSAGDDEIRDMKYAIRERLAEDHVFVDDESGVTTVGFHKKVTLVNSTTVSVGEADAGIVYVKDVAGKAELFYMDEDDNEIQLTSAGAFGSATTPVESNDFSANGDVTISGTVAIGGAVNILGSLVTLDGLNPTIFDVDPTISDDKHVATKKYVDDLVVSYNESNSEALSATSADETWVDSGLTAITFTPGQATNIIDIRFGIECSASQNGQGLKAVIDINGTKQTLYPVVTSNTTSAGADFSLSVQGSFTTQLAASEQIIKLYFHSPDSLGTCTASKGFITVTETRKNS